ncbi:DNA-directed RNA polymerase subunit K [archaeon]|nr:DNA-directed RNA polymerase subunit K [archaeon]
MKLSKYEHARIVGSRALQIAMGAPFLIKLSEKDLENIQYNPIKIAQLELDKDALPIMVKKPEVIIHSDLPEVSQTDLSVEQKEEEKKE